MDFAFKSLDELPNFDLPEWSDLKARSVDVSSPWLDNFPKGPKGTIRINCDECTRQKIKCEGPPLCLTCQKKGKICVFSPVQPRGKPKATSNIAKPAAPSSTPTTTASSSATKLKPTTSSVAKTQPGSSTNSTTAVTSPKEPIAPAKKTRKPRCDKGVPRGKRKAPSEDAGTFDSASQSTTVKKSRVQTVLGDITSGTQGGGAGMMDIDIE